MTTTIDALTSELGDLVADASGLPTSIDPVRPPAIPGCFVGPPAITPDAETGGRLLLAQWEIGALVPAVTGAWSEAAAHAEHIASAIVDHPTLGLVEVRSRLFSTGDTGEAPGYRIDVAVLLHQSALQTLVPPVPPVDGAVVPMTATASLVVAGEVVPAATIDGAAALTATAALTVDGAAVAIPVIDGAAAMVAHANLVADGSAVAGGISPPDIAGLQVWLDASDTATITASAGKVSQWASKANSRLFQQATSANQPTSGSRTLNGLNTIDADGPCILASAAGIPEPTAATYFLVLVRDTAVGTDAIFGNPGDAGGWIISSSNNLTHNNGSGAYSASQTMPTSGPILLTLGAADGQPIQAWVNGVAQTFATGTATAQGGLAILGRYAGGPADWPWDGPWAEFIVYHATLNATQRGQVEAYLKAKWGLP